MRQFPSKVLKSFQTKQIEIQFPYLVIITIKGIFDSYSLGVEQRKDSKLLHHERTKMQQATPQFVYSSAQPPYAQVPLSSLPILLPIPSLPSSQPAQPAPTIMPENDDEDRPAKKRRQLTADDYVFKCTEAGIITRA